MSSIGMIVKAERDLEELPENWTPAPLGSRSDVIAAVASCMPMDDPTLALTLRVEEPEESEDPRTISAMGVWGPREAAIIKYLCDTFDARFFDAESCEFVQF